MVAREARPHQPEEQARRSDPLRAHPLGWADLFLDDGRIEPRGYLADVITRIVTGHPNSRLDELLPWAYTPVPALKAVA